MAPELTPIPGWDGLQAGLAVTGSGEPVVLYGGRYRVGLDGPERRVPGWRRGADAGIAVAGRDLVVLAGGRYRTGRDLDSGGAVSGWTDWTAIPEWPARRAHDLAAADLDGDGRPELIVVAGGRYRVGWGLEAGVVTGGWEPWTAIPDWPAGDDGVGAAVADLDGDGRPELLVLRGGRHTVGWGLDATGRVSDGWSPWAELARRDAEGSIAAAFEPAAGSRPRLMTVAGGHHATQELALDVDEAASRGAWRLLDFDSQILAVHAALLHTGDVLLFAGSGADADDHEAGRFRTRVWHYPGRRFSAPRTPIDLFCAGQAWLAGGRLLAAGGTRKYGPFRGIRDALAFDPGTRRWVRMRRMLKPRWYPTLVTLGDGRVLSVSGRGAGPELERIPEVFEAGEGWRALPSPGLLPWYPHLFLLEDGRVFYAGGQMSGNRGARPLRWKLSSGAAQRVPGLPAAGLRNQAASVLVGPAQDQRVMIVGGGGADIHEHGGDDDDHHPHEEARAPHVATDSVAIADLSAAEPRFRRTGSLHEARMHLNATLLPDRTVLVNGGARVEELRVDAALHAELYDPRTRRWTLGAKSRVPRLYHSISLLTPDGKVVTAGSNPRPKDDELRIEVFLPPYLFRGPRPRLELPRDRAAYGARMTATAPGADRLREVNLLRVGSTTHAFNSDQRLLDVPFEVTGPDRVRLRLPGRRNVAPPGWYLVFAVDLDGVPSVGRFLRLG